MTRLTTKNSTIFIATGNTTQIFHSLSDVPPVLRRKLQESTHGLNSATILIADKRGREELVRALQGHPTEVECRLAVNLRAKAQQEQQARPRRKLGFSLRTWIELLLPVAIGGSLWLFIGSRF